MPLDDLIRVSTDASSLPAQRPLEVRFPTTHQDVIDLVTAANTSRIPLVARGAGTGTTGGCIPTPNSLVVDFSKMNQILEIDTANRVAVVQPGVITQDLHHAAEAQNLFYPPDPASLATCTIGGNIAENAGGPRGYKYGVTRDYVLGLKGVWANGSEFTLGGKLFKNVTGYDLISLLVGSEGTLALITEITLKLVPKPPYTQDLAFAFPDRDTALGILHSLHLHGLHPAVAEWMDQTCLTAATTYCNQTPITAPFCLLFQLDAFHSADLADQAQRLTACCQNAQPLDPIPLWTLRRNLSPALRAWARDKTSQDIVVPPAAIGPYLDRLHQLSQETGFTLLGYGHLGDGNIHVNLLNIDRNSQDYATALPSLTQSVFQAAIDLGGTLTGEHGIGLTKKAYLPLAIDPHTHSLMKSIKATFDPHHLLNPGKAI